MEVYLDNSATTKPSEDVVKKVMATLGNNWGNPSSLHTKGVLAENLLEESRGIIASSLNVKKDTIFFSSSGSLSNNVAINGAVDALKRRGNHIITTTVEHPSVTNTINNLKKKGFRVTSIIPNLSKNNLKEKVLSCLTDETVLVSIMMVNNEIGQYLDVFETAQAVKAKNPMTIFHTDGVQAYMKYRIDLSSSEIDLFTFSGHKIHGPKGIAGLYIKKNTRINPTLFGGKQEGGYFPGTQNPCFAAALAESVLVLQDDIEKNYNKVSKLKTYAKSELLKIKDCFINLSEESSPYIISAGIEGIRSEILLHYLEGNNIFVSSGSACSKGEKSTILKAYGFENRKIDSTIRISLSCYSKKEEIDFLIKILIKATQDIRRA